ncbi:MAG: transglutaminase domain-containing protein [Phycisphaerales bacterium]
MKMSGVMGLVLALGVLVRAGLGADPTIVAIDPLEASNRAAMRTAKFESGTFGYALWRRGGIATIEVEVSADFSDATHEIAMEVSNAFKPTPLSLTLTPSSKAPAPGAWALQYNGTSVKAGKKIVQLSVQSPDDAPIGKYALRAIVREKGNTAVKSGMGLPKPVVLLFNPWNKRDAVFLDDEAGITEYISNTNGIFRTEVDNKDRTWRYGQFDPTCLNTLLKVLDAPNGARPDEQMTTAMRSSPALFAQALAAGIGSYVEGNWSLTSFAPSETAPWKWQDSNNLFSKFGPKQVKYARCWVYANMLTSLYRCAGLPARSVSCIQSAHEGNPTNNAIDIFQKKVGNNWVTDTDRTVDRAWGFHAWNEAWMKRTDRPNSDGWQALDGTYGTGPAPVKAIAARSGGNYEVDSFVAAVSLPIRFHRNGQVVEDTTSIGKKILTQKKGAQAEEDIVRSYKPAARNPGGGDPGVVWDVPESAAAGADVVVRAHLSNPGLTAMTIDLTVSGYAECYSQDPRGLAWGPESRQVVVLPGQPDQIETFTIPWGAYASFASGADHLRVDSYAVCDALDKGWPKVTYVVFDPAELSVVRTSAAKITTGGTAWFTVTLRNTASTALTGCTLTLSPLGSLDSGGTPEVVELGSVAQGASVSVSRGYVAAGPGDGALAADVESNETMPWSAQEGVVVSGCPADLSNDGLVDDDDFVLFAEAYDLLTVPPAEPLCDFNGDLVVNDADFGVFAQAYDALICGGETPR